jgi:hypothetical protein
MAALQTSRNAHNLAWLLRFRIGLRLAIRRDPRLWNHFYPSGGMPIGGRRDENRRTDDGR